MNIHEYHSPTFFVIEHVTLKCELCGTRCSENGWRYHMETYHPDIMTTIDRDNKEWGGG